MPILAEYHRPATVREVIYLLRRSDRRLVPLAGGSHLIGQLQTRQMRGVDGVVDLAGLALHRIEERAGTVHIGATTTLTDLIAHPVAGGLAGSILRRTARYEGPVNLRNQATIGGVVASAAMDSELYAALLALDASVVTSDGDGETTTPLAGYTPHPWAERGVEKQAVLITQVRIPILALHSGHARVARTPLDRCVVAAVAVVGKESEGEEIERVALCGVAPRPILAGQPTAVPDDFKGSAAYRQHAADVVKRRALAEARAALNL